MDVQIYDENGTGSICASRKYQSLCVSLMIIGNAGIKKKEVIPLTMFESVKLLK